VADTLLEQLGDDLDVVYDTTFGFAETVTGPAGDFVAVFDNEYYPGDLGGSVIVSSSQPALRCRDDDALEPGDPVTVRSVGYVVAEAKPNGRGETILRLQVA